jgi:hypothetical protein
MSRRLSLPLALVFALASTAHAQLVLNRSFAEAFIGQSRLVTGFEAVDPSAAAALAAQTGPNQTWDFSNLAFEADETITLRFTDELAGLPNAALFPTANVATIATLDDDSGANADTSLYDYQTLTDTELVSHGLVLVGRDAGTLEVDTFTTRFDPPDIDLVWPLTFGTTWRDSSMIIADDIGGITSVGEHEVDGWGTLVTPAGTSEVLRITSREVESIPEVFSDTSYVIRFIAVTGATAEILLDADRQPVAVTYEVFEPIDTAAEDTPAERGGLRLDLPYPHPVTDRATVRFTVAGTQPARVSVFDLLGREVAVLFDGRVVAGTPIDLVLDASPLPAGVYIVRLTTPTASMARPILHRP